jgi:DNA-binding Lrp family transcriptional regulator
MPRTGQPAIRLVGAAQRAFNVLDALAEAGTDLGTNEIARRTGINPSTVSRLLATLVAGGLVARNGIHVMPELRQRPVHALACAALIAERAVFGDAMPRVVGQALLEIQLRRRVELLPGNAQGGHRHARRQFLRPQHRIVLDGHQE